MYSFNIAASLPALFVKTKLRTQQLKLLVVNFIYFKM
jgi:hypothetical protein